MNVQDSTPKPENAQNRATDTQRLKQCNDERLSNNAGYGRTTNTPQRTKE